MVMMKNEVDLTFQTVTSVLEEVTVRLPSLVKVGTHPTAGVCVVWTFTETK